MANADWRFGVVANIVKQHEDPAGVTRYGTKEFVGGTKVYLHCKDFDRSETKMEVIGLGRCHYYENASVSLDLLENIRFQIVRKPEILRIMDWENAYWAIWHGRTAEDKRDAKRFIENWKYIREGSMPKSE